MFNSRWRRGRVLLLSVVAAAAAAAGCGSGGHATGAGALGSAQSTGARAASPFSPAEVRGALLTRVNGVPAAIPAHSGTYASLPEVRAANETTRGITVTPEACAKATLTGFNSAVVASAPAAAVSFRVGANGVSEVLVAPSSGAEASALGSQIPAPCDHYTATVDGKTFRYTVRESAIGGIGKQARVLNISTAGNPSAEVWSIVYRGTGFVGAVTVVGPNASELAVRELGPQAYAFAAESLS